MKIIQIFEYSNFCLTLHAQRPPEVWWPLAFGLLCALFPQMRRIFVHFSLQIAPWQLFTFHSKYPPILRRNPHRRARIEVIYLTLTVKHEVSKSWLAVCTKYVQFTPYNSMPWPPPPTYWAAKNKEWKLLTTIPIPSNGFSNALSSFPVFMLSWICHLDIFHIYLLIIHGKVPKMKKKN